MVKGFYQIPDIDYSKTFSPIIKLTTIKLVLALALWFKWSVKQLDVNKFFLNGDLTETVYMMQPSGFVDSKFPNHVCRLQTVLYDLKQSPQAWFNKLSNCLVRWGF